MGMHDHDYVLNHMFQRKMDTRNQFHITSEFYKRDGSSKFNSRKTKLFIPTFSRTLSSTPLTFRLSKVCLTVIQRMDLSLNGKLSYFNLQDSLHPK